MADTTDPQSPQGNQWTIYTGVVTRDKDRNSREIEVHSLELLPFLSGELNYNEQASQVHSGESARDGYSGQVTTTNAIKAEWFGAFTNRPFPPDVVKGEQVLLITYGDTDRYFWFSLGRDDKLRTQERLRLAISARTPKAGADKAGANAGAIELDDDNCYCVELDSLHGKHIKIWTSKANGEKYAYVISMDAATNTLRVCDDADNEFRIESETPRVLLRNRDGCVVDLCKKNLLLAAVEDLIIKVGRQTVWDVPVLTMQNKSGHGAMRWNVQDVAFDASKSFVIKSPAIGLDGAVVAKRIVSGPIKSTGYSTGSIGGGYSGVQTDIRDGNSNLPKNPPNEGGGDNTNRHAAGWEQVRPALYAIADCLDALGVSCDTGRIRQYADDAVMNLNRGE